MNMWYFLIYVDLQEGNKRVLVCPNHKLAPLPLLLFITPSLCPFCAVQPFSEWMKTACRTAP